MVYVNNNENPFYITKRGDIMKLVTFQSLDAVKDLFENRYLECNKSKLIYKKQDLPMNG